MIASLQGRLIGKFEDRALIETGGIGFAVLMPATGLSRLPELGEEVQVHTYLQVREDAFNLYGFLQAEERELFLKLIDVGGVGPKTALSALSLYSPKELALHIVQEDIPSISQISGIGKKTASRIVLELKGSLEKTLNQDDTLAPAAISDADSAAQDALLSMGFTLEEASLALKGAPEPHTEAGLLQYALKRLGGLIQ